MVMIPYGNHLYMLLAVGMDSKRANYPMRMAWSLWLVHLGVMICTDKPIVADVPTWCKLVGKEKFDYNSVLVIAQVCRMPASGIVVTPEWLSVRAPWRGQK